MSSNLTSSTIWRCSTTVVHPALTRIALVRLQSSLPYAGMMQPVDMADSKSAASWHCGFEPHFQHHAKKYPGVAQLVGHMVWDHGVGSSSLPTRTNLNFSLKKRMIYSGVSGDGSLRCYPADFLFGSMGTLGCQGFVRYKVSRG